MICAGVICLPSASRSFCGMPSRGKFVRLRPISSAAFQLRIVMPEPMSSRLGTEAPPILARISQRLAAASFTGRRIKEIVRSARPDLEIDVASNPEFLREGNAIADFMRPDRVVIGAETDRAREVLGRLYRPLNLIETPIVYTQIETAELTKYAGNAFLAMKVTFINERSALLAVPR